MHDGKIDSIDTYTVTLIVTEANGGYNEDGNTSTTPSATPAPKVSISGIDTAEGITVKTNTETGNAAIELGTTLLEEIFAGAKTVVLTVPSIPGINSYTLGVPAGSLSSQGEGTLTFSTPHAGLTIPGQMLEGIPEAAGKAAAITISQADKSSLPEDVIETIGDRPVVQLSLTLDGTRIAWDNPGAPVTVSIPYTPTAAELANPESILVWYIDGSGSVISIPDGYYDAATGTVTFTTTHFSYYAVSFNPVSFKDVASNAWYAKAVSFIAAREITTGTGGSNFSPELKLTRGQFIVMLMRAYGIAPGTNPKDNFADAGNTWYTGYLAAAKRLGISAGVGNNLFAPEKEITRQEMFTLLYNALKVANKLPKGNSGKSLSDFDDAGDIAPWAKEATQLLVEAGAVTGSGNKLLPRDTSTRAQMAQIIYNLFWK